MPTPRSPVLVGRRAELATALGLVDAAARGHGGALLVTGEAGVGKSRLVDELRARAAAAGMTVLVGRSVDGGGTYRAVTEALARLLRTRAAPRRPRAAALPRGAAQAAARHRRRRASRSPPARPTPRSCSARACSRCWPGSARCSCWRTCTGPTRTRSTSCATSRARWSTRRCCWWRRPATTSPRPGLARLAADVRHARRCTAWTPTAWPRWRRPAAARRSSAAEREELVARADGLPLLVEELLAVGPTRVPPSLAGLVAGRCAWPRPTGLAAVVRRPGLACSPHHRVRRPATADWRLLACGRRPARRWSARPGRDQRGRGGRRAVAALRAAADVGLLVVADGQLRFRHALTRDAVLATLLPPERAALAARAARVLDARGDRARRRPALPRVRRPGPGGRDPRRAGPRGRRPGRRAQRRGLPRRGGRARRARRARARADPARPRRRGPRERRARRRPPARRRARGAVPAARPRRDRRRTLGRRAVATSRAPGAPTTPAPWCSSPTPRTARATSRRPSGSPAPPPTAARDPALLCEALCVLGRSTFAADPTASDAVLRRVAQVAAEHGLPPWRVQALFGLGSHEHTRGDPVAPSLAAARELAMEAGMLVVVVQADLLRANAILLVDGPVAALPLLRGAAEQAGRLRLTGLQAMAELFAAIDAGLAGDEADHDRVARRRLARPDAPTEVTTLGPMVRALPHLLRHILRTASALLDEAVPALLDARLGHPHRPHRAVGAAADRGRRPRRTPPARRLRGPQGADGDRASGPRSGYADAIAAGRAGRATDAAAPLRRRRRHARAPAVVEPAAAAVRAGRRGGRRLGRPGARPARRPRRPRGRGRREPGPHLPRPAADGGRADPSPSRPGGPRPCAPGASRPGRPRCSRSSPPG